MSMSCYGKWKNTSMCEMCIRIGDKIGSECKKETEEKNELANKLYIIKKNCKYRDIAYDEYNPFDSCNKNGNGSGKFADDCCPKLECEQYCIGE